MSRIRPLVVSFASLTLFTGALYPALVTALSNVLFREPAHGSLLVVKGRVVGSRLIAQATEDPGYFWSRPSSTVPFPTHAAWSTGSTLALSSPALAQAVTMRIKTLKASDPTQTTPIPMDLITSSASGLDPHISREAALWQVPRIARHRHISEEHLRMLIERHTHHSFLNATTNVMTLNAALDQASGR